MEKINYSKKILADFYNKQEVYDTTISDALACIALLFVFSALFLMIK